MLALSALENALTILNDLLPNHSIFYDKDIEGLNYRKKGSRITRRLCIQKSYTIHHARTYLLDTIFDMIRILALVNVPASSQNG